MEPIERLPAESARALEGVCFDVDDTITTHGVLDPDAYRSLFALRDAGLKLIAVTGRPLGFAEVIARMWPVDAAVGENGAGYVARSGRDMRSGYWDDDETRTRQAARLAQIRARVAAELPSVHVSSDGWARRCDLAFDVAEQAALPPETVARLVSIIEAEGAHASVSSIHAHAQLGRHDKASGLVWTLGALWSYPAETVRTRFLFVGDSGNDAAAFAWFALTAGVANVRDHLARLPRPPAFVASARNGQGFAEIARTVLTLRRGEA